MKEHRLQDGSIVYYDYDEFQDMLYLTFTPDVGPTYYSDVEGLDGVMLRYDGQSNTVVGMTVHNVRAKMERMFIEDLYRHLVRKAGRGHASFLQEHRQQDEATLLAQAVQEGIQILYREAYVRQLLVNRSENL
jgi:transcription initiation factor TFIIIB Brf1 subunit/transcription initiation factor TFIIB